MLGGGKSPYHCLMTFRYIKTLETPTVMTEDAMEVPSRISEVERFCQSIVATCCRTIFGGTGRAVQTLLYVSTYLLSAVT